jgi:phosphoribosylglycinamide formyltransferase 1
MIEYSTFVSMKHLALFASGSGSNVERIATYFANQPDVTISIVLTNNPQAGVIERCRRLHLPVLIFDRHTFTKTNRIVELLQNQHIDLVVLAGFLWLIPENLVRAFPDKILNIHPALLPKFGGKGMYGHFVHEAVVAAGETESGITIHRVNEHYDEGAVVFQARCPVLATDSPADVALNIQALEHEHFARVISEQLSINSHQ